MRRCGETMMKAWASRLLLCDVLCFNHRLYQPHNFTLWFRLVVFSECPKVVNMLIKVITKPQKLFARHVRKYSRKLTKSQSNRKIN